MATSATPSSFILHLGLGSFHRAHLAVYMHALHQQGDTQWALKGGNIRPDTEATLAALRAQHGTYTLETVTPEGQRSYTWVRSIQEVAAWDPDLTQLVAAAQEASTRIISFTVTEAGYYLQPDDQLDGAHPEIQSDLQALKKGGAGTTLYGALAALLRARMVRQAGAVTLLNCDNLRHNGQRMRSGFLQFLRQLGDADLLAWVQAHTTCPNAMVDRITPRPTAEVVARVKANTGRDDPAALMAESFIQWVIEDQFANGRPQWESVGVQMVESVAPYEEAKIRLLNATHSCIAWAGTLAGMTYIHEGTHDARIRGFAYDYVTEDAIPVLLPSPIDLPQYRDVVLSRFGNHAICDTNQRVAMDGFSKIPGFIAPTVRQRLARQESVAAVAMLPALFLACLQRWHQGRLPYDYQDQAMDPAIGHAICASNDPVAALAADAGLWGDLVGNPQWLAALRQAYERVQQFEKDFV
jgi:D-arabinitol 4-dehydrogenase